jgi:hypothetical protein
MVVMSSSVLAPALAGAEATKMSRDASKLFYPIVMQIPSDD